MSEPEPRPRDGIVVGQAIDRSKIQRSRELRRTMTPAEAHLWERRGQFCCLVSCSKRPHASILAANNSENPFKIDAKGPEWFHRNFKMRQWPYQRRQK